MKLSESIIQTDRLNTRKLNTADDQAIFEIFSNSEVTRYWSSPAMTTLLQAQAFIRQTEAGFKNGSLLEWGVIEKESNKLIGTCAYSDWDRDNRRAEIGFAMNRHYWGKGFMKELLREFIPFGFNELELHRIEADVDPHNHPAIHLLEYFGFKREGKLRERFYHDGTWKNSIIYGLLSQEFKNPK